jgi:hypothetical protein
MAEVPGGAFVIPDDHRPGVREGLAEAERGEFAGDEDIAGLSKRCGWRGAPTRVLAPRECSACPTRQANHLRFRGLVLRSKRAMGGKMTCAEKLIS